MGKVIRPTYPKEVSIGVLILIFIFSYLLSHQIFDVRVHELKENKDVYYGMFLVSLAVITMVLIMWEEILFPVKIKEAEGGMIFRNHRTKLKVQLLIYLTIPAIFTFIYMEFEVNHIRFAIWALVCMVPPVIEKIFSGINNYNDFLKLTVRKIEYKNNEKEGSFKLVDIDHLSIIEDERKVMHKIEVFLKSKETVLIDLDEMELDDFIQYITAFINDHYKHLLKGAKIV
ncbi:MAG: putative heavy metal rane efflux protein [Chitinophagaceae bacterium]|nr:putative heavy metal rane efflux protein [Chitinophagaceae bacterium]